MDEADHCLKLDIEKQLQRPYPVQCRLLSRKGTCECHGHSDRSISSVDPQIPEKSRKYAVANHGPMSRDRPRGWAFGHTVSTYGCLFFVVVAANAVAMLKVIWLQASARSTWLRSAGTPIAVNLMGAALARNEHFVNVLFRIACIRPTSAPFAVRAALSQVHHYGGLHSGCALAAVMWYCLETALVTTSFSKGQTDAVCVAITWVILALLVAIVVTALPFLRRALHDYFEVVHRFAGWSVLILIWFQVTCVASLQVDRPMMRTLSASPATWFLVLTTMLVIYPWLRMRKKHIRAIRLSRHALQLQFEGRAGPCTAVKLSDHPMRENHPFACIPQRGRNDAFSVIVSRAGDWTSKLIESPPKSIWIRQTPQRGVLWVARMFSPVVIVATGSGIGPCLGLFNGCHELSCRVLWSTRQPAVTYGEEIIASVRQADPQAVIIDTDQCGRPDLPREAEKLYREAGAEAVVVISNRQLTRNIVTYLARRGICARGPIWDS